MKKIASALALVGLLGMLLTVAPARAAQASPVTQPQAVAIGVVDLTRFNADYRGIQQLNQDFQEFQDQAGAKLRDQAKTRMLDDREQREYLDLSTVGAPTDANKKRMEELAKLSDDREQKLSELDKKQARTPDEQKDYDTLTKISSARMGELTKLQTDLQQATLAKREELMKVIDDSVNGAIRAVAEQRKLTLVLDKQFVRFGGVDITEDVLAKLNAGPLPKPPAAAPTTPTPSASTPAAPKTAPAK